MRTLAGASAVVLLLGAGAWSQDRAAAPPPRRVPAAAIAGGEIPRRAGEFRIETKVTVPAGALLLELWVPAPRVDEFQSVTESSAPAPHGAALTQQTDPESGNTFLHLKLENPQGTLGFDAAWKFERREAVRSPLRRGGTPDAQTAAPSPRDLAPSQLVPVTGRMKARSETIVPDEKDPLNVARGIYDEVLRSLEYATKREGWGRGDALWALDAGYGDSADFAALFVGLARARGIPARFLLGFPLSDRSEGPDAEIGGYTAWAEFFVPDIGWVPVDLAGARLRPETRQYGFGNLNERRIHFTSGRDIQLAPPSKRGPHNYLIYPYAEIDGEPAPVTHRFIFKEK